MVRSEGAAKRPHYKAGRASHRRRSDDVLTLPKFDARAATNGHEIKLAGKTGEACGKVTLPIRARHGSRYGQTVIVESEILP